MNAHSSRNAAAAVSLAADSDAGNARLLKGSWRVILREFELGFGWLNVVWDLCVYMREVYVDLLWEGFVVSGHGERRGVVSLLIFISTNPV